VCSLSNDSISVITWVRFYDHFLFSFVIFFGKPRELRSESSLHSSIKIFTLLMFSFFSPLLLYYEIPSMIIEK